MKHLSRSRRIPCVLAVLAVLAPASATAEPRTVESFNRLKDKWPQLVGASLQLEGRVGAISDSDLRLAKCNLRFLLDKSVKRPAATPQNLEVVGRIDRVDGELVFVVVRLKALPTDRETVATRRAGIETSRPEQWYELADWTAHRARFYDDEDLLAEAADLYENGVLAEYRRLPADDFAGLFALADKVRELELPDALRMRWLHEALRRELEAARRGKKPGYPVVLTQVLQQLPGSHVPLPRNDETQAVRQSYLADPLAVYARADDDRRRVLHRVLYAEAALEHIRSAAAGDGSNGYAIAARIEQTVPDFPEVAEEHRQQEIDFQRERVTSLTRDQLLELCSRLEQRQRPQLALSARERWLKSRDPQWRERGVHGLMELAGEYEKLLGDEDAAADIYREIDQQPAGRAAAREWLLGHGYSFVNNRWTKDPDAADQDPLSAAIRMGLVRPGMTADQVRASLGGEPDSVLRVASRGVVIEIWNYPDRNMAVHLTRRGSGAEAITREVVELRPVRPSSP